MAGRKRKPAKLHLIQGTARADRDNPAEPDPAEGIPRCPIGTPKNVRKVYKRLAAVIDELGILTMTDGPALLLLATMQAELDDLNAYLAEKGMTYKTRKTTGGFVQRPRPELGQRNTVRSAIKGLYAEFGLTPAARTKVTVTEGRGGQHNEWNRFKKGK